MYIIIDSREKPKAISNIIKYFDAHGIQHETSKLLFGDYIDYKHPELAIDRKQNIAELAKNCTREHIRFRAELERAKRTGSEIVILVEQNRYKDRGETVIVQDIADLIRWESPHTQVRGEKIFRVLASWRAQYPLSIEFCDKRATGRRIIEILSNRRTGAHNGR